MKYTFAIALLAMTYARAQAESGSMPNEPTDESEEKFLDFSDIPDALPRPGFKPTINDNIPPSDNTGSQNELDLDEDVQRFDMRDIDTRDDVLLNGISLYNGEEIALLFDDSSRSTGFIRYVDEEAAGGLWEIDGLIQSYVPQYDQNGLQQLGNSGVLAYKIRADQEKEGSSTFRSVLSRHQQFNGFENFDASQYPAWQLFEFDINVSPQQVVEAPQATQDNGSENNSDADVVPICKFVQEDCDSDGTECITDTWAHQTIELNRLTSAESNSVVHMINREQLHIEISDGYQKAWNWTIKNMKELMQSDIIRLQGIRKGLDNEWDFKIYGCNEEIDLVFQGMRRGKIVEKTITVKVLSDPYYSDQ